MYATNINQYVRESLEKEEASRNKSKYDTMMIKTLEIQKSLLRILPSGSMCFIIFILPTFLITHKIHNELEL